MENEVFDDGEKLPSKLWLIDQSVDLVREWQSAFSVFSEIEVIEGSYFQKPADAIVSPANSFGIMDGGFDLAIRNELGYSIQGKVQNDIVNGYHGELPVGSALCLETGDGRWKYLIAAPTMRVPENVSRSLNAYLAFRAILLAVMRCNTEKDAKVIDSLVCCGLCTGVGGMSASRCANQMAIAYKSMIMPALIGRFESIHQMHASLRCT